MEFRRPPREVFGELVPSLSSHLRLRLSPDVVIALGMRVKVPGERMAGEDVELIVTRQPGESMTPYERLLGDALRGDLALFGRQDAIEAQWAIVDPVLGDATPVYEYALRHLGPARGRAPDRGRRRLDRSAGTSAAALASCEDFSATMPASAASSAPACA